jgi:hypothetical protein
LVSFLCVEEDTKEKGKLYKPTSRFVEHTSSKSTELVVKNSSSVNNDDNRPDRLGKKKVQEKKKSNLEIFKEELKM